MTDTSDAIDQLPTEITPARVSRLLTAAEFHRLADVPPEVEWFANLSNPHTRRVYENAVKDFMRFKVPAKIAAPLAVVSALRKPRLPKRRLPGPRNRASRAPRHRRETRRAGAGTGRAPQQSGLRRKKP